MSCRSPCLIRASSGWTFGQQQSQLAPFYRSEQGSSVLHHPVPLDSLHEVHQTLDEPLCRPPPCFHFLGQLQRGDIEYRAVLEKPVSCLGRLDARPRPRLRFESFDPFSQCITSPYSLLHSRACESLDSYGTSDPAASCSALYLRIPNAFVHAPVA